MSETVDPSNLVKKEVSEDPPISTSTPKGKAVATPRKRKSTKKDSNGGGEDEEATPTKRSKSAGIPDRYEDLAAEDKLMLKMKGDGKGWKDIQEAWFTMTGKKHTGLATRYIRVKAAISRVKDDDLEALEKAMAKAEERIEEEKKMVEKRLWAFVAEGMESEGADKYDLPTLEKAWKRLQANNKAGTSKYGRTATVSGEE